MPTCCTRYRPIRVKARRSDSSRSTASTIGPELRSYENSGSQRTSRWREVDSNPRSPAGVKFHLPRARRHLWAPASFAAPAGTTDRGSTRARPAPSLCDETAAAEQAVHRLGTRSDGRGGRDRGCRGGDSHLGGDGFSRPDKPTSATHCDEWKYFSPLH